jgi:hypothetical protein
VFGVHRACAHCAFAFGVGAEVEMEIKRQNQNANYSTLRAVGSMLDA